MNENKKNKLNSKGKAKVNQRARKKIKKEQIEEPVVTEVKNTYDQKEVKQKVTIPKKEKEITKKKYIVELTVIILIALFLLILLCNRTFFRDEYKTSKMELDIPHMLFYLKDDGNEAKFVTLRKSDYVKDFFSTYLEKLDFYNCGTKNTFYYDQDKKTAIYSIDVKKNFALKWITINYTNGEINELCK